MSEPLCIFHIDLNFVCLKPEYLRQWLRDLAGMGYNAILWELEDKVRWESCPDAIWPEAMSKAEFRQILDEARTLGLESIPLLQTVGHAEYILMRDAYRDMRELPDHCDCYCTENPAVRDFLKQLIAEYLDLFGDIHRFHLGGDEAYVFAKCPICTKKADAIGRNALYSQHIMDISEPIRQQGIRAGIWGDMILNHPQEMAAIPRELEIWDWNYWDLDGPMDTVRVWDKGQMHLDELTDDIRQQYPEILREDGKLRGFYTSDALRRMGYDVILCSAARSSGDSVFCPRTLVHSQNIAGAASRVATAGLSGTCVTSWAIRLNSWNAQLSMLPIAPQIMKTPEADLEPLRQLIASELFGTDAAEFVTATDSISSAIFPFSKSRTTAVQWTGLKDSLPTPPDYIRDLLADWEKSGRMDQECAAIDETIVDIRSGVTQLEAFALKATTGHTHLQYWIQIAKLQLRQAEMAREILARNRTTQNTELLRSLKHEYETLLGLEQTPQSAAKNAGLVYDCLIEYVSEKPICVTSVP